MNELSGTEELVSRNPATGEHVGAVPVAGPTEVRRLVERSRGVQGDWARRSPRERARALERLRRLIAERADEIADLIRAETGKVPGEALGAEVLVSCEHLRYLADRAPRALRSRRAGTAWFLHRRARIVYEPYGVVGAITPWNYPFAIGVGVVSAAIVAGNGVVLKPSELTPLCGLEVGALAAEATGLDDLVQVATGDGSTGAALVDGGVDKITFTGSVATGRAVMKAAAEHLTPVLLELGGKDAMIVCGDADVERAARGAVWGAFYGCGQVCQSVERAYVVDSVYDEFVRAAVAEARRVRTSDEEDATIGALISPQQVEIVERHVEQAREQGARIRIGGRRVQGLPNFFEPTVITDVDHEMEIMRDETFGPVLPVMRVADEEEAVRLANDTEFGLDASVWSRDRAKARRLADQLRVGTVLINDHLINYALPDVPFGGVRGSGFGRVHGLEGLREFVRPKPVIEDRFAFKSEAHWFEEGGSGLGLARGLLDLRHGPGLWRRVRALPRLLGRLLS